MIQPGQLDQTTVTGVRALLEAARRADGVMPMSEQARLQVRLGTAGHLLDRAESGELFGYAQLAGDGSAELVVHPDHRRNGVGRSLAEALLAAARRDLPAAELRVWAHGDHPGAAALATALGFARARVLWQLRRPLSKQLDMPEIPNGVAIGTFEPARDSDEWLALNAAAFADHPEQGRWTRGDLSDRMAEPWFDPAGFFIARRAGGMVGFHWTKEHDPSTGEVYVVGVAPSEQGGGLGMALTLIGLHHLRDRGLSQVILYVDESNVAAVRLYQRLRFTRSAIDVQYARPLA